MDETTFVPEGCTHDCTTCGNSCEGGESKLEKTLYAIADIETDDLLAAFDDILDSKE